MAAMSFVCIHCAKDFKSKNSVSVHHSKFKGSCGPTMTNEEYGLLGPVQGDWLKFYCKGCEKTYAKRGIFTHLEKHHPEASQSSWDWWIKWDYNMIKQNKAVGEASPFNHAYNKLDAELNAGQQLMIPSPAEEPPAQAQAPMVAGVPLAILDEDILRRTPATPEDNHDGESLEGWEPAPGAHIDDESDEDLGGAAPGAAQDNQLATMIHGSEERILTRIDEVVGGFNMILQQGLGEVQAKYQVALPDWLLEWNVSRHGKLFPTNKLASNYNLDTFKLTILEFMGAYPQNCWVHSEGCQPILGVLPIPR